MEDTLLLVILLGGFQGLFQAALFISSAKRKRATFTLSFIAFSFVIILALHFISVSKILINDFIATEIISHVLLIINPLILWYVIIYLYPSFSFRPKYLIHFAPFLLFFVFELFPYMDAIDTEPIYNPNQVVLEASTHPFSISSGLRVLHYLLYVSGAWYILLAFEKKRSDLVRNTPWIQYVLMTWSFIGSLFLILYYTNILLLSYVVPTLIVFSVFMLGYYIHNYPELFRHLTSDEKRIKYQSSTLTRQKKEQYKERLLFLMNDQLRYKDVSLNLDDLANELQLHRHQLSQVINEQFGKSFSDFVNMYRVQYAQELLSNPVNKNLTILAIAYEAGFNSKSAFYKAFKKLTRQTPTQFVKNIH